MAQVRISQLVTLTTVTGDDLLVIVQSGSAPSLTTFKTSIQNLNDNYFAVSGSVLSSSFASHVTSSITASNLISASYSKTSSIGEFLNFNGSFNGTASWAVNVSSSISSSLTLLAISSSRSISSSIANRTISASFVQSSSFAASALSSISASTSISTSYAFTASYANLSNQSNFPKWYGPFTASGYSGSIYGWTDPIFRGLPIVVLYDNTDLIFQASVNLIHNGDHDVDSPGGPHSIQVRWKEITSSANPGTYQEPSYSEEWGTADDIMEGNAYYGGGGFRSVTEQSFLFSKSNVKRGTYILWFESKFFKNTNINNRTYGTLLTDGLYTSPSTNAGLGDSIKIPTVNFNFDKAQSVDNNDQLELWIWPHSGSVRTTIYATNEVKQGIMFAPTASVSFRSSPSPHYDFIGQLFGGKFGRVYAVPFLVDANSVSIGQCQAVFSYTSGSSAFTADFSASTSGLSVGSTTVAFLGNLPGVAKSWAMTFNPSGILLSTIPIRTNISSSWV